jgi:hypothetical protein
MAAVAGYAMTRFETLLDLSLPPFFVPSSPKTLSLDIQDLLPYLPSSTLAFYP